MQTIFKGQCKKGFDLEELNELYPTQFDTLVSTSDILMLAANISSGQSISMLPFRDMMDHFPSPSKAHAKKWEWSLLRSGIWSLPSNEDGWDADYDEPRNDGAPWRTGRWPQPLTVGPVSGSDCVWCLAGLGLFLWPESVHTHLRLSLKLSSWEEEA